MTKLTQENIIEGLREELKAAKAEYDAKSRMCRVYEQFLHKKKGEVDWDFAAEIVETEALAVLAYSIVSGPPEFEAYCKAELEKAQERRQRGEKAARERAEFARARITFRARTGKKPGEAIYAPTVRNMQIATNDTPVDPITPTELG